MVPKGLKISISELNYGANLKLIKIPFSENPAFWWRNWTLLTRIFWLSFSPAVFLNLILAMNS